MRNNGITLLLLLHPVRAQGFLMPDNAQPEKSGSFILRKCFGCVRKFAHYWIKNKTQIYSTKKKVCLWLTSQRIPRVNLALLQMTSTETTWQTSLIFEDLQLPLVIQRQSWPSKQEWNLAHMNSFCNSKQMYWIPYQLFSNKSWVVCGRLR